MYPCRGRQSDWWPWFHCRYWLRLDGLCLWVERSKYRIDGRDQYSLDAKAGFPSRFAAGVEAAASTGGQLMPPVMGAGAFIMASYTQIPYVDIIAVSFGSCAYLLFVCGLFRAY